MSFSPSRYSLDIRVGQVDAIRERILYFVSIFCLNYCFKNREVFLRFPSIPYTTIHFFLYSCLLWASLVLFTTLLCHCIGLVAIAAGMLCLVCLDMWRLGPAASHDVTTLVTQYMKCGNRGTVWTCLNACWRSKHQSRQVRRYVR